MSDQPNLSSQPSPFSKYKDLLQESITKYINEFLKGKAYNPNDAPQWTHSISESIVKTCQEKDKEFKYAATCIIINKSDGGFHMSSSCYWNSETDGNIVVKVELDTLYCIANVFGFSLN